MATSPISRRRTDLDLLRVVACIGIVLAHALLIYAAEPRYHVKSAAPWAPATILYEIFRVAILPLFFTLAGWSAVGALRRRTPGRFLRERVLRVLLPLFAGILLLGPVIKWIELQQGRDLRLGGFRLVTPPDYGFVAFLGRYLTRIDTMTWSHLWFLAYLFIISVVTLPALRRLAGRAPVAEVPGRLAVYLPAVGFAVLIAGTGGYWPFLPNLAQDWANMLWFIACFGLGAMLAAWPGYETRLRAEAWGLLALGLVGFIVELWLGPSTLGRIAVGLCAWGWIGGGLGIAGRYPPPPSRLLDWLGEATMPVYVLHHIPVLLLGVWLLAFGWGPVSTILGVWLGATAITLLVYRFCVRPFAGPRLLVGMPPASPGARPG